MKSHKHHFKNPSKTNPLHGVLLFLLSVVMASTQAQAGIRVIDESAITYMQFLSKATFDQRFPGQGKFGPAELDSGWYVIYIHKNLNYYFGPILLESTGQDYHSQLASIVNDAVQQRPSIQDYELVLRYEPSTTSLGDGNSHGTDETASGTREFENSQPKPKESPPQSSFWALVRKIFGL